MRKCFFLLYIIILVLGCTACNKTEKEKINVEPEISQMKAICELATMECYFHNVAKYYEEDAQGSLWWKKDKHFWIEYSGVVTLGIDVSLLDIEVNDDIVTISLPEAKVLGNKVDETTLTEDSFIVETGSAEVKAEDQTKAYEEAQRNMVEAASNDTALLNSARQRAQILLEDYVNNIGNAVGKEYKINWVYVDSGEKKNDNNMGMENTSEIETE